MRLMADRGRRSRSTPSSPVKGSRRSEASDRRLCQHYEMALQLFGMPDGHTIPNASVARLWRIAITAGLARENTVSSSREVDP